MPFSKETFARIHRQKTAREANRKYREYTSQYMAGKIDMQQLIQRFYDISKNIHPPDYLDPQFLMILNDTSGLDGTSNSAFSMAQYESTKRLAKERGIL